MGTIEKDDFIVIPATLMYQHIPVVELELQLSPFFVHIVPTRVLCKSLMPQALCNQRLSVQDWFLMRCLRMNTHRNVFFMQFVIGGCTRSVFMPFLLSLLTNSVNLTDKYWLNPVQTITFQHEHTFITFSTTTWGEVNPFRNKITSLDLNSHALNDRFSYMREKDLDVRSLLWTTCGDEKKRWIVDNNQYVLEKALREDRHLKESEALNFFAKHEIKVPLFESVHQSVDDDARRYDFDTITNGHYLIRKTCLTNQYTHLEALAHYVNNDDKIAVPIRRMCAANNVSKSSTDRFIDAVESYVSTYSLRETEIDTNNLGLLVHDNGFAEPAVWSGLQLQIPTLYQHH